MIGLSLASMFPLWLWGVRRSIWVRQEQRERSATRVAASSVGFVILPAFVGVLADYHGVGVALPVAFTASCVLGSAVVPYPGSVVACDGFGFGLSLDGLSRSFWEIGSESREVAGIQHALPNARSVGEVVDEPQGE